MKITAEGFGLICSVLFLCGLFMFSPSAGCAGVASLKSWGKNQHITLYSNDGKVIGNWRSDGQIQNENYSDGFHFMDAATKKQIRVTGTTVVTTE